MQRLKSRTVAAMLLCKGFVCCLFLFCIQGCGSSAFYTNPDFKPEVKYQKLELKSGTIIHCEPYARLAIEDSAFEWLSEAGPVRVPIKDVASAMSQAEMPLLPITKWLLLVGVALLMLVLVKFGPLV